MGEMRLDDGRTSKKRIGFEKALFIAAAGFFYAAKEHTLFAGHALNVIQQMVNDLVGI